MNLFQEVKSQISTVEIAEKICGLQIKRSGKNKIALCPFHADKNPSLTLFSNNSWHCFACGASGGDGIALVSKYFNLSQIEAAKKIIADLGLNINLKENKCQYKNHSKPSVCKADIIRGLEKWQNQKFNEIAELLKTCIYIKENFSPLNFPVIYSVACDVEIFCECNLEILAHVELEKIFNIYWTLEGKWIS